MVISHKKIVLSALFLFHISSAHAADYYAIPGENLTKIPNVAAGDKVLIHTTARKSHCCTVWDLNNPTSNYFGEVNAVGSITPVTKKNRGADTPIISFIADDEGLNRKCFYHEDTNPDSNLKKIEIPIIRRFIFDTPETYFKCEETTLYGSFNTSVTDFNFVEITNKLSRTRFSDAVVNGKIVATDSISNSIIMDRPFSINPGSRIDIDIHSVSDSGKFGTIIIYHDGTPGALSAVTSQYKIRALNPLDFEPVTQTDFTTLGTN